MKELSQWHLQPITLEYRVLNGTRENNMESQAVVEKTAVAFAHEVGVDGQVRTSALMSDGSVVTATLRWKNTED